MIRNHTLNHTLDHDQESNAPFKKRARETSSDNKRLLGELPQSPQFDTNRRMNTNGEMEIRSHIESAQAEELIRKSRDTNNM